MSFVAGPTRSTSVCADCAAVMEAASQTASTDRVALGAAAADDGTIDVIDLFCGCGGLSAGFRLASPRYRIAGAFDTDADAVATYQANVSPRATVADLTDAVSTDEGWAAFLAATDLRASNPLVLIGGPPCQGFSAYGKRRTRTDARNDLIGTFAEIAVRLEPDLIVLENVPELLARRHWGHFSALKDTLEAAGYNVRAEIHNLAAFGVPQERFRALVVASRGVPSLPAPVLAAGHYRTVRDAIAHLEPITPGEPSSSDPMHHCTRHRSSTIDVLRQIPPDGGSRPKGVGPRCLDQVDGFRDVYGRLRWDRPANTVTASARNPASGRFAHPAQHRGLTVREASLLQGFPDDFLFTGSFDSKFSQVGNAVPPRFAAVLGAHCAALVHGCAPPREDTDAGVIGPQRDSFSSALSGLKRAAAV
jgi:DNA (cytosine-5)-methyltransferase 1